MNVHIDGGSRGNPGPAGFGVRVSRPDGTIVAEISESIGVATNNVAEYRGLLGALAWAVGNREPDLVIHSDSELLVKQMRGEYRVKHPGLQPLHAEARRLVAQLRHVRFVHVRREENSDADALANRAMDEATSS
jgi:ribonuclease HI